MLRSNVNCMIYLGDYRSLMTIDGILDDLHNSIVEDEEGEVEQSVHLSTVPLPTKRLMSW